MDKNKKIIGVFKTEEVAIEAIKGLKTNGYTDDEISVLAKQREKLDRIEDETHAHVEKEHADGAKGAVGGAVAGGVLGGAGALLAEFGLLAIPGIGPILAAGPIAATLAGVVAGGAVGGVAGALIDLGVSKTDAKEYEKHLEDGKILVLVDERENKDKVYEDFYRNESLNRDRYDNAEVYRERHNKDVL